MTDDSGTPQFATADYATGPAGATCKACAQRLSGSYYRVNGAATCADCTRRLQEQIPQDSHRAFARGMVFGVGAAILGFAIYVAFALMTGLVIGYVSLAVGYLVGKAIALGSRGAGGPRYQIAALLLTYMAVSLAAVPIALSVHMKHKSAEQHARATAGPAGSAAATAAPTAPAPPAAAPHPKMTLSRALGTLALLGLASPFLELADPMRGIIGLIILLVGIRIAWRLTAAKALEITGPVAAVPAVAG